MLRVIKKSVLGLFLRFELTSDGEPFCEECMIAETFCRIPQESPESILHAVCEPSMA